MLLTKDFGDNFEMSVTDFTHDLFENMYMHVKNVSAINFLLTEKCEWRG